MGMSGIHRVGAMTGVMTQKGFSTAGESVLSRLMTKRSHIPYAAAPAAGDIRCSAPATRALLGLLLLSRL